MTGAVVVEESNRATCDHQMKGWRVWSKAATAVRGKADESGQREVDAEMAESSPADLSP